MLFVDQLLLYIIQFCGRHEEKQTLKHYATLSIIEYATIASLGNCYSACSVFTFTETIRDISDNDTQIQ
jgi:hypothetical protein